MSRLDNAENGNLQLQIWRVKNILLLLFAEIYAISVSDD